MDISMKSIKESNMHPHLVWLVKEHNCPNCRSAAIQSEVNNELKKVNFKCCCGWRLSEINYSDISKLITVTAFQKHVKDKSYE